jgi:hypothetical protein
VVEQRHSSRFELADVMHKQHVIGINIGPSTTWEFKKAGRFRRFFKARGGICFFPSHQPFSCRPNVEKGVIVNILFLALDPVFVGCACGGFAETGGRSQFTPDVSGSMRAYRPNRVYRPR